MGYDAEISFPTGKIAFVQGLPSNEPARIAYPGASSQKYFKEVVLLAFPVLHRSNKRFLGYYHTL